MTKWYELDFESYALEGHYGDMDVHRIISIMLDELMPDEPSDRLRRLRMELRIAQRWADLYTVELEGLDRPIGYNGPESLTTGISHSIYEHFNQVYLDDANYHTVNTLFHRCPESEWHKYVASLPRDSENWYDFQRQAVALIPKAFPQHFRLTSKKGDLRVHSSVGLETDPPWHHINRKGVDHWISNAMVEAGVVIQQEESGSETGLEIENKHPTDMLMLSNDAQDPSSVTISAGNKASLSAFSLQQGNWTVKVVEKPAPVKPIGTGGGDDGPDAE